MHREPKEWRTDPNVERLRVRRPSNPADSSTSPPSLFSKLCGSSSASETEPCRFESVVVLDETIPCAAGTDECLVDSVRTVEVVVGTEEEEEEGTGIVYEYVRPPCVRRAFFQDAKVVVQRRGFWELSCADPMERVASPACCDPTDRSIREWKDVYWGERTTFATAEERCGSTGFCDGWPLPSCDEDEPGIGTYCNSNDDFWTTNPCTLRAKIDRVGNVGIIHVPDNFQGTSVFSYVADDTKTFFRVDWSSGTTAAAEDLFASCEASAGDSCWRTDDGACMCDVSVSEEQVFSLGAFPSRTEIENSLHIGSVHPLLSGLTNVESIPNGITLYTQDGILTADSVFEYTDDNGILQRRKNTRSTVRLDNTGLSFRNPVHFISLTDPEPRDAYQETEAVLDHYFYHPNTAPFVSIRLAQRFGISNPSPRYVRTIGDAFRSGTYSYSLDVEQTVSFGSGRYGDLAAAVACVLLDREARAIELEADPTFGSLREPLLKVIGLLRSMEYSRYHPTAFVDFDLDVGDAIGQMAHDIPNVFSFFLPEHQPPGPVSRAGLVAPEGQVLSGPRLIDTLNGLMSVIRYGLGHCYGGFGAYRWYDYSFTCDGYEEGRWHNSGTQGKLGYAPTTTTTTTDDDEDLVDEVATLLTAGRLSPSSREIIRQVVRDEPEERMKILRAQELTIFSPEFHGTNRVRRTGEVRPDILTPPSSSNPYKAIVYLMLEGGVDSHNMLVPHTCSATNPNGQTLLEQYHEERTTIAMTDQERYRIVDASGQPCTQFAIHQDLPLVEQLYRDGDLAFFANAGVINRPADKDNYYEVTRTQLFAHNAMQEEAMRVDPFDSALGTGVLGRACDALNALGFNARPITVEDATVATVGAPGGGAGDPLLVSTRGSNAFNAQPPYENWDPRPHLDQLNGATVPFRSSLFGETWSRNLLKSLHDNELLLSALANTRLYHTFPNTIYGGKLKAVATLIASYEQRGTDRDVFFVSLGGWDHHADLKRLLSTGFQRMDGALSAFVRELKERDLWDDVTLVMTSDFGRTLTANSGEGSDHAWGGNYFAMGGSVRGGQIYGDYPPDITSAGPLNLGRGRLIPTMSWESIWHGILDWFGIPPDSATMDGCLPNRLQTETSMLTKEELFDSP